MLKSPDEIELGDRVRDMVGGVVGIVTQRIENLNGCVQFSVRPPNNPDGKVPEYFAHDWQNLEMVEKNALKRSVQAAPKMAGGPESKPARSI